MPQVSEVHIDAALTNVSVAYQNPAFAADVIVPPVPVRKQSDKYYIYDPERERFRSTSDHRAPGAKTNEIDFGLSTDNYFCDDHALASAVPDEERANADPVLQPAIDRTEFLTEKIALNKEIALASRIITGSDIPGESLSGTSQWSDYDDSDPVSVVEAKKGAIQEAVQEIPNTLVLPYQVFQKVRLHPKVTERMKYTGLGIASPKELAELFDVDQVLVPRALKNTAARGQTASLDYVWGKNAFLCYIPPRPGLMRVSLGYTFVWTMAPGNIQGYVVETWRDDSRKSDMVRVQRYYDQKITAPGACYLWKDAVA